MTRPNILWLTTHDINPHLGCYAGDHPGAEVAHTPHLDQLAAEGVRFRTAFASAPVCAPSRSAVITGCHPAAIGTMHMRTKAVPPPEVHLLPELFRASGWWTGTTGFTDHQVVTPPVVYDEIGPSAHWRNRADPDQPFFLAVHGSITHESRMYVSEDEFAAATPLVADHVRHDPQTVPLPPYHPDTDVFRTAWARYHDLITQMDAVMGQWLAELEEDGLADNTIVVFWSDHGPGLPRAKRWVHDSGLREPLIIRWPGVIEPDQVHDGLVQLMDLAPTMLTAAGLDVPEHMHGVSLLDEDRALVAEPHDHVVSGRDRMDEQRDMSRTVRDRRFRYIRNGHPDRSGMQHCRYPDQYATWAELRRLTFEEACQIGRGDPASLLTPEQRALTAATKPAEELYDLIADPHEIVNLVDDPAHAEDLHRLRGQLDEWTATYGDLGLVDEAELIERWRPAGRNRQTSPPLVVRDEGTIRVRCDTDGATLAWTDEPPTGQPALVPDDVGTLLGDGRHWRLVEAEPVPKGRRVWLQAWRIGFDPSEEVVTTG